MILNKLHKILLLIKFYSGSVEESEKIQAEKPFKGFL